MHARTAPSSPEGRPISRKHVALQHDVDLAPLDVESLSLVGGLDHVDVRLEDGRWSIARPRNLDAEDVGGVAGRKAERREDHQRTSQQRAHSACCDAGALRSQWNSFAFPGVLGIINIIIHVAPYFIVLTVVSDSFIRSILILRKHNTTIPV